MHYSSMDSSHLAEGIVEQDPLTDLYSIRILLDDGTFKIFRIQEELAKLNGQEVRLTLISLETLDRLTKLVEEGGVQIPVGSV